MRTKQVGISCIEKWLHPKNTLWCNFIFPEWDICFWHHTPHIIFDKSHNERSFKTATLLAFNCGVAFQKVFCGIRTCARTRIQVKTANAIQAMKLRAIIWLCISQHNFCSCCFFQLDTPPVLIFYICCCMPGLLHATLTDTCCESRAHIARYVVRPKTYVHASYFVVFWRCWTSSDFTHIRQGLFPWDHGDWPLTRYVK